MYLHNTNEAQFISYIEFKFIGRLNGLNLHLVETWAYFTYYVQ